MAISSTRRDISSNLCGVRKFYYCCCMSLRKARLALRISQSRLARVAGVSRFKICTFELGSGSLAADEKERIRKALHAEADRLRDLSSDIEFESLPSPVKEPTSV
jgi:hypothetical protein